MQYLEEKRCDEYWLWVDVSNPGQRKEQYLMRETLTEDDFSGFKKRNFSNKLKQKGITKIPIILY